jgi:hypothetical protein
MITASEVEALAKERDAYREALTAIKRHQEAVGGGALAGRSTIWIIADRVLRRFDGESDYGARLLSED